MLSGQIQFTVIGYTDAAKSTVLVRIDWAMKSIVHYKSRIEVGTATKVTKGYVGKGSTETIGLRPTADNQQLELEIGKSYRGYGMQFKDIAPSSKPVELVSLTAVMLNADYVNDYEKMKAGGEGQRPPVTHAAVSETTIPEPKSSTWEIPLETCPLTAGLSDAQLMALKDRQRLEKFTTRRPQAKRSSVMTLPIVQPALA